MPPKPQKAQSVIGRCYCGACSISGPETPVISAYCHCVDCRRWTGAPAPAFAAFLETDIEISPAIAPKHHPSGVARINCPHCGSPLLAKFPYLPEQVYIPLGMLDTAAKMPPSVQCHTGERLPWVALDDELPGETESARTILAGSQNGV